eukprot:132467-Pelagomonas_calceolata.AAC.2
MLGACANSRDRPQLPWAVLSAKLPREVASASEGGGGCKSCCCTSSQSLRMDTQLMRWCGEACGSLLLLLLPAALVGPSLPAPSCWDVGTAEQQADRNATAACTKEEGGT